jgi:hypothetical protein
MEKRELSDLRKDYSEERLYPDQKLRDEWKKKAPVGSGQRVGRGQPVVAKSLAGLPGQGQGGGAVKFAKLENWSILGYTLHIGRKVGHRTD